MTTFRWVITDASDELTPALDGGSVDLSDVRPIKGNGWDVEMPDDNLVLTPVDGGAVGANASGKQVKKASADETSSSLSVGVKFNQTVTLAVLIVLCVGFLAVVVRGVLYGTLDFQTYTSFILSLLAGIGLSKTVGGRKFQQGGGSG